ncbi:putative F-box protein At5g55150 [Actinidia eriantha]|uniref:putative F-box protein At5g55150 n=1 Tax=Actinidia eriantha TaxID=165200 RepID=UPI002586849A|nr:putative F-box protein At5g55150 [Actinidia eriantha]
MSTETWSALPEEILELIFELLTDIFDLLRSQGVCFSWRYVAMNLYPNPTTPLLLLPSRIKKSASREYVETISISFGTTPPMVYRVQSIDVLSHTRCVYSYRGWLLMKSIENRSEIYLYNPFTTMHVQLPELPDNIGMLTFITSCSPNDPDCVIFLLCTANILHKGCICKRGDREWRKIFPLRTFYEDMIYYKDAFYAIDKHGKVDLFNYRNCPSTVDTVSVMDMHIIGYPDMYLVESSCGELWVVVRQVGSHEDTRRVGFLKTKTIKVFKLTWSVWWEEVRSFPNQALLLTHNDSMFVPVGRGYRGNCIYFTDDLWIGGTNSSYHDYGVYDLASQKIEQFIPSPKILDDTTIQRWFRPGI